MSGCQKLGVLPAGALSQTVRLRKKFATVRRKCCQQSTDDRHVFITRSVQLCSTQRDGCVGQRHAGQSAAAET